MEFYFSVDMHDKDGDRFESGVFIHLGSHTILHFASADEVEELANELLKALPEIRDAVADRY